MLLFGGQSECDCIPPAWPCSGKTMQPSCNDLAICNDIYDLNFLRSRQNRNRLCFNKALTHSVGQSSKPSSNISGVIGATPLVSLAETAASINFASSSVYGSDPKMASDELAFGFRTSIRLRKD